MPCLVAYICTESAELLYHPFIFWSFFFKTFYPYCFSVMNRKQKMVNCQIFSNLIKFSKILSNIFNETKMQTLKMVCQLKLWQCSIWTMQYTSCIMAYSLWHQTFRSDAGHLQVGGRLFWQIKVYWNMIILVH